MFSCEIIKTSYEEIKKMTKEDLLKAMKLIIDANEDSQLASQLIWDLWQAHADYTIIKGKVLHKDTGKEIGK
jgi:hypothetical protein